MGRLLLGLSHHLPDRLGEGYRKNKRPVLVRRDSSAELGLSNDQILSGREFPGPFIGPSRYVSGRFGLSGR